MFNKQEYSELSLDGEYVGFMTPTESRTDEDYTSFGDRRRKSRKLLTLILIIIFMLLTHYLIFRGILRLWSDADGDANLIQDANKDANEKDVQYNPLKPHVMSRKDPILDINETISDIETPVIETPTRKLSYEDAFGNFIPHVVNGRWISEDEFVYFDINHRLIKFDAKSKRAMPLIDAKVLASYQPFPSNFWDISADKKYIIYNTNVVSIFRYSTLASYHLLELASGKILNISLPISKYSSNFDTYQVVKFGPIGNQLIVISNNDIYYASNVTMPFKLISILNPGAVGVSFNGVPDWVYEEEIFKSDSLIRWSPKGTKLAFIHTDDDNVSETPILILGRLTDQNVKYLNIKYPKPGGTISSVSVHIVELDNPIRTESIVSPPFEVTNSSINLGHYITSFVWIDEERLLINYMNRHQNISFVSICGYQLKSGIFNSYKDWSCEVIHIDASDKYGGWVNDYGTPMLSKDKKFIALIMPQKVLVSDKHDYYSNIMLINIETRKKMFIFRSPIEVKKINYVNNDKIYFEGVPLSDPLSQHLFMVNIHQHDRTPRWASQIMPTPTETPTCLTCRRRDMKKCHYNSATFPDDNKFDLKFYVRQCTSNIPFTEIFSVKGHQFYANIENNIESKRRLKTKYVPKVKYLSMTMDDGLVANIKLILPPHIDTRRRYPLLIKNYGAPRFQSVTKENIFYEHPFNVYLASDANIITAIIDGHGSANQGFNRSTFNYKKLGSFEVDDQILVTKYILDTFPDMIDSDSVAIMGTSYGGYVALKTIAKDTQMASVRNFSSANANLAFVYKNNENGKIFKCAIAESPVTDWFFYDAVYSERYMGKPGAKDNEAGYLAASLFPDIDVLIQSKIFLIQGSADDNVHIDQSLKLMRYIIDMSASKGEEYVDNIKYMLYPDQNHYFRSFNAEKHSHLMIKNYLLNECFD